MSNTYLYYEYIVLFICVLFYSTFFSAKYSIKESWNDYQNKDIMSSMIFLGVLISFELLISYLDMGAQCQGGISGMTVLYVILVWVLLLGGIQIFMLSNPGIKSAFSDVIGYYYIYNKANKILSQLLNPESTKDSDKDIQKYISEVIGDKALYINTMVPANFEKMWESLSYMSDPKIADDQKEVYKQKLLDCVVIRDRIGECCWYVWTGILCISILSLHANTINCPLSKAQLQKNAAAYALADSTANPDVYVAD